jgi:hypothetical protein
MPDKKASIKKHTVYHKDGTLWATGSMQGGQLEGYWEWFRRDGTKMRSGYFRNGVQVGEWTTYDGHGRVYKVTEIKAPADKGNAFPKISAPALRALQNAKIKTLKDLAMWSEREILALHGMGPSTLPKLRQALKGEGLAFKSK